MKIAIDISPLDSGHKVRGVGFYVSRLKTALEAKYPEESFTFFKDTSEIDSTYDVIHYPYFDPFLVTLPLQGRKKIIVTVHDLTPLVFPDKFTVGLKGKISWELQKRLLRGVGGIITDSDCSKRDIMRLTQIPSEKIHVVYLAAGEEFKKMVLSKEEKRALTQKYKLPERFGLYVGDATWNKNIPKLVGAIGKSDIPFVMVGKALAEKEVTPHPWNKDLRYAQEKMKDMNNIQLLGFVPTEDLVKLYNCAEIFVMPSFYEGFGLSILEAMQLGCPVVTTKKGSLPEVAGDAAYMVDADHEDDIAHGIRTVLTDSALKQSLIKKGFVQARKFSWQKAAIETKRVYELVYKNGQD